MVTQPEYAIWFNQQGFKVENYGVDPDVVVENDPHSIFQGSDNQLEQALKEIQTLMKNNDYIEPQFEPIKNTSFQPKK